MGGLLPLLRRGSVSTDAFLTATRGDFERMAAGLLAQYRRRGSKFALPTDVAEEDVANRMRMIALQSVGKWDPTRGVTLESFVTFRTFSKVRRWVDERRGAARERAGSQPSCFPLLLADLFTSEDEDRDAERAAAFVEAQARAEGPRAGQEEQAAAAALLERLRGCGLAVGDGTLEGAVEAFEASKALREMARRALFTRPVGGAERRELAGRFDPAETIRWSGGMAEEGAVLQ